MSSSRGIGRPGYTPIEGTTLSAEREPPHHPPRGAAAPYKSPLLVAVGVALGILAASVSPRPAAPPPPPDIGVRSGHVEADGSFRALTPRSIRVGDRITRLAQSPPVGDGRARVYLDVNGEGVIIDLEVEPRPAGVPTLPSDSPARPVAVGVGDIPRIGS